MHGGHIRCSSAVSAAIKVVDILRRDKDYFQSVDLMRTARIRFALTSYSALLSCRDYPMKNLKRVLRSGLFLLLFYSETSLRVKVGYLIAAFSPRLRIALKR